MTEAARQHTASFCSGYYTGYDLEGGSSYQKPCWRNCGCERPGCPALAPKPAAIVHIVSQDDQPYGSERRCCNHCGAMVWVPRHPPSPHVNNWTDWRAHPDRCGQEH